MSSIDFIVAGLGNPGKEYVGTRHNAGFMAIDYIANKLGCGLTSFKFKGLCGTCEEDEKKILLLKPQTFMNLSGQSVVQAMSFYKVKPQQVILLFDDISLPPGKIRIRKNGSHGGQNGAKNIFELSKSNDFPRVKIGIGGKPNPGWDLADWVLSKFSQNDLHEISSALENIYGATKLIINGKTEEAMNLYN